MHRRVTTAVCGAVLGLCSLVGCGGGSPNKSEQGRSVAQQAGLPKDVADFFALAASGLDATYRVTIETTDADGKPLQVTTTQRPPNARFDAFHADGSIDATIALDGRTYQCTMAANHWDCGDLGVGAPSGQIFGPDSVRAAIDAFKGAANEYDFRVETRDLVGVKARCLVTTRKPGLESDTSLGASATLCLSSEGVILLIEVPSGSITATAYSTTIPDDAFTLPASPSTTVTTSTVSN